MTETPLSTARGAFEIVMAPGEGDDTPGVGRWTFDKTFTGDLEGTSRGQMLGCGDPATGSAGYVVVELVDVRLDGRRGGFALQHFGVMDAGALRQQIEVVPGTGIGELKGIAGTFTIDQDQAGDHVYALDYTLPQ